MTSLLAAAANVLDRADVLPTVRRYLLQSRPSDGEHALLLHGMAADIDWLLVAVQEMARVNPDTQTAGNADMPDCNTCPRRYAKHDRWQTVDDQACGEECKPRIWHLHGADNMRYGPELVKTFNEAVREGER